MTFSKTAKTIAFVCFVFSIACFTEQQATAQTKSITINAGEVRASSPRTMTPEMQKKMMEAKAKAEAQAKAAKDGGKKPEEKKGEENKDKKDGDKKPEEKKGPVTRESTPPEPADETELDVRPDEDGKVRFNFRGQPWKEVLDWLSEISHESLDWQELPGDYLNLTTQKAYSVDEVRDLINERLLSRGYTILNQREGFMVVKLDKIDPAQVPRVHPEDLRYRDDHELVKVSFTLSWLIAGSAVEELKPMLSPHGKMTPLKTSNRIEAMDTVVNLREIYHVLQEEQSSESQASQVNEFQLQYVRADIAKEYLEGLLGMSKQSGPKMPMTPQQMQMLQQQMQRSSQNKGAPVPAKKAEVHLVVNQRRNSILANAPPDKLVIIAQSIKMLDVPTSPSNSLTANMTRMQIYRLAQLDPETLIKMLEEAGDMDPGTQLIADKKNKAVIAYASIGDHFTVKTMIDKLDGSGRRFEVIRLRRLKADSVAGTIQFMMGKEEEKKDSSRRSSYYSYYSYRSQPQEDEGDSDKFRVDADVVNNRLLLWTNDIEYEEVTNLLMKLGEIPASGSIQSNVRSFNIGGSDSAADLIRRLKEVWPSVSPSPLEIEIAPPKVEEPKEIENTAPTPGLLNANENEAVDIRPPNNKAAKTNWKVPAHFAQVTKEAPVEEAPKSVPAIPSIPGVTAENFELYQKHFGKQQPQAKQAPPVTIKVDENGRMTVTSDDPRVLDLLEDLMQEMAPPPKQWEVFQLEYASAYWVSFNLEDFFEEEEDDSSGGFSFFYGYSNNDNDKDDPNRLSNRKPIKFITDIDTNTILVQGADNDQLATIKELIKLYDVPQEVTSQSARMTSMYQVKYSRATIIADAVKDVFRDLLSTNDKALQGNQGGEQKQRSESRTYITNIGGGDEKPEPTQTKINFKGKISIGIDEVTNTLLFSIEGESLMNLVLEMVKNLDEAAKPVATVKVLSMSGLKNPEAVKETLSKLLDTDSNKGKGQPQGRPENNGRPPQGQPGQNPNQNGNNKAQPSR